ncbi:MAG: TraR/DksA C4-type zinc finger protein [Myxococcaceae bacterium]|nr:TraR/DksA C4-type zinc finger protein [Myxococcaceae bacterium]
MTPAQRKQIARLLHALLTELTGRPPKKIEPNRTSEVAVGGDEDEQPLNEMLQSIASNRNRNSAQTLAQVRRALAKLEEEPDDFGVCENCGEDILFGRLKAMPFAELCTECQAKLDAPRGPTTRRKITDYV